MTSAESTAIFRRAWSLYDLIAAHNYMYHREIYAKLADLLMRHQRPNRYRVLDLGCGNARFFAPCLMQSPPAHYEGVDLSEAALEEARGYLAKLPCPVVLRHGDLLEAAESTDKQWDVVFTGFALHHLTSAEKARFFRSVERSLSDSGWLLMVDVVREENQSREDYLAGYLRLMREQWTQIPRDQLETACEHVAAYDYPESPSTLASMAGAAGLTSSLLLNRYGQHYSVLFSRHGLPEDAK
ncbi:MAG: class I SAM-dependent methyltransferase [Pseudomonadota bacterium]|nr:MAG: class I SAM-dependent methyltransferase [Pseudomonadota bacterium]